MAFANLTGYSSGSVAWMAHVGGLVFAYIFLHAPSSSSFDRIRKRVATVPDDSNPQPIPKLQRHPKRRDGVPSADDVVARSNAIVRSRSQPPMLSASDPQARAADVDALLDKISREGMGSLSRDERALLQEISRKLRGS
jgi:hypothetical protein